MNKMELMCCVVTMGHGSKALKIAKTYGVRGGTIFLGMGTSGSRIMELLELADIRKELVFMLAEEETAKIAMRGLSDKMHFAKPKHGIVFSIPLAGFIASKNSGRLDTERDKAVNGMDYSAIWVVVEKGLANDVVDASKSAGARGGTIIGARGSGIHEHEKVFAMEIEPEKELVMILVKTDIVKTVVQTITEKLRIDEPGNGVIFVTDVHEAIGLV